MTGNLQVCKKTVKEVCSEQALIYYPKIDFCLTVHHQLGKVIQMNQLDATMIY